MFKKITTVISTLLLLGGIVTQAMAFDKNVNKEVFEKQIITPTNYYTFVRVETVGHAEAFVPGPRMGQWEKATGVFGMAGSGTVLAPGWVITAAHVVNPVLIEVIQSAVGSFRTKPMKVIERFIHLYDYKDNPTIAWIYYMDTNTDVALLRYVPRGFLQPINVLPESDYDLLGANDVIAIVTHERNNDWSLAAQTRIVWGTVLSASPIAPPSWPGVEPFFSMATFTCDLSVYPGDSGSLVFAFKDGVPVYMGIISARIDDYMYGISYSYANFITPIIHRALAWSQPK